MGRGINLIVFKSYIHLLHFADPVFQLYQLLAKGAFTNEFSYKRLLTNFLAAKSPPRKVFSKKVSLSISSQI